MSVDCWQLKERIWNTTLTISEKALLIRLADRLGENEWCWPSQQSLANDLSLSLRRIKQLVKKLRDDGILDVSKSDRSKRGNQYRINCDRLQMRETRYPKQGKLISSESKKQGKRSSPRTSTHGNKQKKSHGGNGVLNSCGGWNNGGIKRDEFQSLDWLDCGLKRFNEATQRGWLRDTDHDRLRFMTLWVYIRREMKRTDENAIREPGGFLTASVKDKNWNGSLADENTARQFLRSVASPKGEPHRDLVPPPTHPDLVPPPPTEPTKGLHEQLDEIKTWTKRKS